jgi:hypothetical protein
VNYLDHFGDYEVADPNNIVIVENFIDEEEVTKIYKYATSVNDWVNQSASRTDSIHSYEKIKDNSEEIFSILQRKVNAVQSLVEYTFGRKLEKATAGIRKWTVGESQGIHADGESQYGEPNETYIVDYGSIMYLNDNYEGGEICFPAYEKCFKPKPGTLIFFPSSIYYLHGVHEIVSGERYTSAHFWVPIKHRNLVQLSLSKK